MPDSPNRKVTAAGLGGAAAVLVMAVLRWVGLEPEAEFGASLATVLAFAAGYLVKE